LQKQKKSNVDITFFEENTTLMYDKSNFYIYHQKQLLFIYYLTLCL